MSEVDTCGWHCLLSYLFARRLSYHTIIVVRFLISLLFMMLLERF